MRPGEVILLDREEGRLGAAAASAAEAGLEILYARAHEGDDAEPFHVARQLFAPALDRLSPEERQELFSGPARLAAPVFAGESPPDLEAVHGLYWLTTHLADRGPIALIVDGAHHADEPSLRVCRYLAERIDELPVALVVARRP